MNALFARSAIEAPAEEFLRATDDVFAVFDERTRDSGNRSYGVALAGQRYFVKTAGNRDARATLDHSERVALLRNAVDLAHSCEHACMPPLHAVIEASDGPLLVYEWRDGELLGAPTPRRADPTSAFQRFRSLPPAEIERSLGVVFDLHRKLADAGWIASDFYDGSLLYDFTTASPHVIDLDHYQRGPFPNRMGRMFGSTRFMAPEEHVLGELIDERSTVYTLGRTAMVFLGDVNGQSFGGIPARLEVVRRATHQHRRHRFESVAAFVDAWELG